MNERSAVISDCWKRVGVQGDGSCPELKQHVHCRNCPVYADAGSHLLSRPLSESYGREWAEHYALTADEREVQRVPALVFRVGAEWLALSPVLFLEVSALRPIHSLPHRRSRAILGLANVRGELQICLSLTELLGLPGETAAKAANSRARLLVGGPNAGKFVFPVDEVQGLHRFVPAEMRPVPATLAQAASSHMRGVFELGERSVGWLDERSLIATCERSLG
jgi:chemotaxis-related protein WspD